MKKIAIIILALLLVGSVAATTVLVRSSTNNPVELNNAGYTAYKAGNEASAEAFFLTAINLDPGYEHARYNLALLYNEEEEYGKAIEQLQTLTELDATNVHYQYDLAVNCIDHFRYDKAGEEYFWCGVDHYKQTEALEPGFAHAKENLDVLYSFIE